LIATFPGKSLTKGHTQRHQPMQRLWQNSFEKRFAHNPAEKTAMGFR